MAGNDPRLDPRMVICGKFWHHTIAYIAPEHEADVIISWLNAIVIPEAVAKADKFCSAYNGELSVVSAKVNDPSELTIPSSLGDPHYVKETYFLTPTDVSNAILCMKAAMTLFTNARAPAGENKTRLLGMIDALDTTDLDAAQLFMATYFDFGTAYTERQRKAPEFVINWIW